MYTISHHPFSRHALTKVIALVALICSAHNACSGEIHDAVRAGDLNKFQSLLKSDPSLVSSKDPSGATPLHAAVIKGDKRMVELLLKSRADVNARNMQNLTPLQDIAGRSNMTLTFGALGRGTATTDPFTGDDPSLAIAELLISSGATVNVETDRADKSPLLLACNVQNWPLAKLLIQKGARTDVASAKAPNEGVTPLHYAAVYGDIAVARLLIGHNATVNAVESHGITPLYSAAQGGHKEVVELLLANGADVNARVSSKDVNVKPINGWTPLHVAVATGHKDVAEVLRQHGGKD